MNNREAFDFLKSKTSVREASIEFMTRLTWYIMLLIAIYLDIILS